MGDFDIFGLGGGTGTGAAGDAADNIFGGAVGTDAGNHTDSIFGDSAIGGSTPAAAPGAVDDIFGQATATPAPGPAPAPAAAPGAADDIFGQSTATPAPASAPAPAPGAADDIFGQSTATPAPASAPAPAPGAEDDIFGQSTATPAPAPAAAAATAPAPAPAPASGDDIFGAATTGAATGDFQIGDAASSGKAAAAKDKDKKTAGKAGEKAEIVVKVPKYVPGKNHFLNRIQDLTLPEIEGYIREQKNRLRGEFKRLSERTFHLQLKYVQVEAEMLSVVDAAHRVHFYLDDAQLGEQQKDINILQKKLLRDLADAEKSAQESRRGLGRRRPSIQEQGQRRARKKRYNLVLQLVDELEHMENQVEELKNQINASSQQSGGRGRGGQSNMNLILKILNSHHSIYTHVDSEADAILQELHDIQRGRM